MKGRREGEARLDDRDDGSGGEGRGVDMGVDGGVDWVVSEGGCGWRCGLGCEWEGFMGG